MEVYKSNFELLAPGGDIDSIKAAIIAGADAVYCGLDKFNARNRAVNIIFDDLYGILKLAHKNNCKIFLTLNIIILESEFASLFNLLNKLINTSIDGIIVQDTGLFYILNKYFSDLKVHASTQCTTHNEGQILFLKKLNVSRVNLSRELNIAEIKDLTKIAHSNNISTEVFVHGSFCISFSGICYMSSVHGGNSGNRGRCSQPCRDRYLTTPEGKNFPLNLKDNSAFLNLRELSDAGVDSLKIEGRVKRFHYVYTVVKAWRYQINLLKKHGKLNNDNSDLYRVFNRDFSNSYLTGDINKNMFIDNPRDNSIKYLSEINNNKIDLYEEKKKHIEDIRNKIEQLNISKTPLIIEITGKLNNPLKLSIKTTDTSFILLSKVNLINAIKDRLDYDTIMKKFKTLNNTEYYIKNLELKHLQPDLFLSFKELTSIKIRILSHLNGSKPIEPIVFPNFNKKIILKIKPELSVLIASRKDIYLSNNTSAEILYQVPDCLKDVYSEFIDLFLDNRKLIPWFPSILIGENYKAAVEFLQEIQPKLIITNNTGIAFEAYKNKILWIAGPYLNIINSFALLNLKENFDCYGSFISNEISRNQMQNIVKPENLKLYYSIYHPILLMNSRQCLYQQVIGCEKNSIDNDCMQNCNKSSSISNLKNIPFLIDKKKSNYHRIYNNNNFLNTDIITDMPNIFSNFLIDLRDIKTGTKIQLDKPVIIKHFENLLNEYPESKNEIINIIHPTTCSQYLKGI